MSAVIDYLKNIMKLQYSMKFNMPPGMQFFSIEHFVFECGKPMGDMSELSFKHWRGRKKECFLNAWRLCHLHKLRYVEGYALGCAIPVLHAWNLDDENNIIDPTWDNGTEYYGIEFPEKLVFNVILNRNAYGVIDNFEERWPFFHLDNKYGYVPVRRNHG